MTSIAYELAIVGGSLADDESAAHEQVERLDRAIRDNNGVSVGPWEYHFPTLDNAKEAAHAVRQIGISFDELTIKPVDSHSGNDLVS